MGAHGAFDFQSAGFTVSVFPPPLRNRSPPFPPARDKEYSNSNLSDLLLVARRFTWGIEMTCT